MACKRCGSGECEKGQKFAPMLPEDGNCYVCKGTAMWIAVFDPHFCVSNRYMCQTHAHLAKCAGYKVHEIGTN